MWFWFGEVVGTWWCPTLACCSSKVGATLAGVCGWSGAGEKSFYRNLRNRGRGRGRMGCISGSRAAPYVVICVSKH